MIMSKTVRWIVCIWCFLYAVILVIALKYESIVPLGEFDKSIFATILLYILAVIVHTVTKKLSVNYAPVMMNPKSALVISFPCGNTFLIIISMCSSIYLIGYFLESKKRLVLILRILCVAVLGLGVTLRTVSGVNYLTDVLGAIGFSVPAVVLYSFICDV